MMNSERKHKKQIPDGFLAFAGMTKRRGIGFEDVWVGKDCSKVEMFKSSRLRNNR